MNLENNYIRSYEYQKNVNPILEQIPITSKNINECKYGINMIDIGRNYNIEYNATTPNLLANFIKIKGDDEYVSTNYIPNMMASSHFFYIMQGTCKIIINNTPFSLSEGDIFISPQFHSIQIKNNIDSEKNIDKEDLYIYYINDSPLLHYLGSIPIKPIFQPAIYPKDYLSSQLTNLSNPKNNRKGILLSNEDTDKLGINTITPVLWCLYNELPPNTDQKPHKHNSVALDLCIESLDSDNIYTLIGEELDQNGDIINPKKIHWKKNEMFITPPGLWHSHHNKGDTYAYILPIQDAGLLLYQRILGIVLQT